MKRRFPLARLWDVVAVAAIAFVLWKIFIAPRSFTAAAGAQRVPLATFETLDGGAFHVADARGRLLFLDFYASWCEPCKVELPLVEAWAKNHPDAIVVPVDVAEPRAVVGAFARKYGLRRVAFDPAGNAQGIFAIGGFPTVIVVDPAGRIRAKWVGLNPAIALAMTNAEKTLGAAR
ncbi:MAG: TlpA disulfide reductase family protein [Candidatus Tumulicola sp.]